MPVTWPCVRMFNLIMCAFERDNVCFEWDMEGYALKQADWIRVTQPACAGVLTNAQRGRIVPATYGSRHTGNV